jgi:hypothetical protein
MSIFEDLGSTYDLPFELKDEATGETVDTIVFKLSHISGDKYATFENRQLVHETCIARGDRGDDSLGNDLLVECVKGWDGPAKKPVPFSRDNLKRLGPSARFFLWQHIDAENFRWNKKYGGLSVGTKKVVVMEKGEDVGKN